MGNLLSQRRNAISFEQENFTRCSKALIGTGTKILQEILESYIPPKDLSSKFTRASHPYLWGRLNPEQRHLIGQASIDGYKDFDITLCYTLLRNLNVRVHAHFSPPFPKPTRGWGNQPLATDTTQSDDIERIRILRNEMYGHLAHPAISNTQFADVWGQLKDVCTRTKGHNPNGTDFLKEISSLEICTVTSFQWNRIVEIVQQNKEHDKTIDDHAKRLASLQAEQNTLNQDLQIATDRIDEIDTKVTRHEVRIDTVEINIQRQSTQIDGHTRQLALLDTEVQKHGTKIDEHDMIIDEHTIQLSEVQSHGIHIDANARKITTLDNVVQTQNAKINEQSSKIDQQESNLSRLDNEARKLVKQIEEHSTDIDKQSKLLTAIDIRNQRFDVEMKEQTRQLDTLNIGNQKHDAQIEGHTRHFVSLDNEIHSVGTRIAEHARQIDSLDKRYGAQIDDHNTELDILYSRNRRQGTEIADIKETIKSVKNRSVRDDKQDVSKLKERLLQINTDLTKVITLSPLQERGEDELPIELLYAQVVICEEYLEKGVKSSGKRKEITEPTDLFMKNGEIVRKIYMLGDAAHGKTTYCIWLLRNWCNAQFEDGEGMSKWETALQEFNFVFLLQFRYVNPSRASVIDMICQDIFGSDKGCSATIRHVLSSDQYRSLIIMDGLDEWNPSKKTRKRLTCQRMPNIQGISSNVSCFFSMRPWVFSEISKVVKISDRVIEILGLSETGMENVIKNVLLNHYNLKEDLTTFTSTFEKIEKHLKKTNLKSFMQIPLLAVVCVQIWYEEKQIEDSMTGFYAEMLNMMIERAGEKHGHQIKQWRTSRCSAQEPGVLSGKRHVVKHFLILLKLGKVAYEGLVSNERNLELEKSKLEEEIGLNEIQFVLDVGLISQKDARSLLTKRVHVHFFHKSVQEFMAAMYISSEEGIRDSFCNHLSSVNEILDLSNVILFMYGMCPSICNVISQHVVNVADNDADICEYRQAPGINNEVKHLYISQVNWYRELQYRQISDPVTFYVSDVLLMYSGGEMVRTTKKLLSDHHVCIRSLYLWVVPTKGTAGISNSDLCNFLNSTHKTRSLTMISIQSDHDDRYVNPICIPSLKILYLQDLEIKDIQLDHHGCRPLLKNLPLLSTLVLRNVHLGKRILGLSSDMTLLRNIQLVRVTMTEAAWKVFISSIKNLHHTFDINLTNTNIDEESKKQIRSSTDFSIKNAEKRKGFRNLKPIPVPSSYLFFTRVWPLSRDDDNDDVEVLYSRSGLSKSKP